MDTKEVIVIERETNNFKCRRCGEMVDVSKAKPWTIETDTTILKTWDYGHQHIRVFGIYKNEQFPVEDTSIMKGGEIT